MLLISVEKRFVTSWGKLSSFSYIPQTVHSHIFIYFYTFRQSFDLNTSFSVGVTFGSTTDDFFIPDKLFSLAGNNPRLIAEGLFAIATVLSFLVLLRDVVIVSFVGPLRVSIGRMISDIVRFAILFIFVWISFALGLTQLYQTYEIVNLANCRGNKNEECKRSPFSS